MSEQDKIWKCPLCGNATNTGNYCESCGALRFTPMDNGEDKVSDGMEASSGGDAGVQPQVSASSPSAEVQPVPVPLTSAEAAPAASSNEVPQPSSAPDAGNMSSPVMAPGYGAPPQPGPVPQNAAATQTGAPQYNGAPQYGQVPAQYNPPPYQYNPAGGPPAQQDNTPTIMCIISLALYFIIPGIITGIYSAVNSGLSFDGLDGIGYIFSGFAALCPIAAIVLMIIVRVKYPRNTFGKVLMWIYIVMFILEIIGTILLILMCATIIDQCQGFIMF